MRFSFGHRKKIKVHERQELSQATVAVSRKVIHEIADLVVPMRVAADRIIELVEEMEGDARDSDQ